MMIRTEYYLVASIIMMFAGIYGFFTRRNALVIPISVELTLNVVDTNFTVFSRLLFPGELEGHFLALSLITTLVAETTTAIAIIVSTYHNIRSTQIKNLDELKW